jgi:hypothetical protein
MSAIASIALPLAASIALPGIIVLILIILLVVWLVRRV